MDGRETGGMTMADDGAIIGTIEHAGRNILAKTAGEADNRRANRKRKVQLPNQDESDTTL